MRDDTVPRPEPDAVRGALRTRRACLGTAFAQSSDEDPIVIVPAGLTIPVEGSDQHHAFRLHDDHRYLAGGGGPAQVLAFDPVGEADGWTLFVPVPSQDQRVWEGDATGPEAQAAARGLSHALPLGALGPWLGARGGRPAALLGSRDLLERPGGYGLHPAQIDSIAFDADLTERIADLVVAARRVKDDVELAWMRAAAAASHAGHVAGLRGARPGTTERDLRIEIEAAFQRAGAERPAYASIVAGGPHAAVLHATPGGRAFGPGDMVLVDAGAEVEGYDSDVTRTWPVDARFTAEQRALYDIVLDVQERAIRGVRPGVEFRDLHMEACRDIARGLVDLRILRGDPDGLVERDAHALFFPHGLGHLIGLATHDVGGQLAGRERSERPGLKYLRIDLPLEERFVVTIEPGIYFVRALLEDPALRRQHHDAVDWSRLDALRDAGGVRIEDDVVVRAKGPEVLTAGIPKRPEDLEALRA